MADNFGITLDTRVGELVRELVREEYGAIGEAAIDRMENMERLAIARWPVKTGRSKASIGLVTKKLADTIVISLDVTAWYAAFIKARGFTKGPAWDLILNRADEIAEDIIKRYARRGR